jgi:hypothetical protein
VPAQVVAAVAAEAEVEAEVEAEAVTQISEARRLLGPLIPRQSKPSSRLVASGWCAELMC